MTTYDSRYLAGIILFNQGDYFEAHEAWEDLWAESHGNERRFVQGLIQAAVGLCHFGNGNLGGAVKLYRTAREYMAPCGSPFWGLDVAEFWDRMERCYAQLFAAANADRTIEFDPELAPRLTLDPPPDTWPDPADYVPSDDE